MKGTINLIINVTSKEGGHTINLPLSEKEYLAITSLLNDGTIINIKTEVEGVTKDQTVWVQSEKSIAYISMTEEEYQNLIRKCVNKYQCPH